MKTIGIDFKKYSNVLFELSATQLPATIPRSLLFLPLLFGDQNMRSKTKVHTAYFDVILVK